MIIRKGKNTRGWTSIPNELSEDGSLSFKARGLLCYLLSRPDNWSTDSIRLARSKHALMDGRDGIRTGLAELERVGYLVRTKVQNEAGQWATITMVYDEPQALDAPPEDVLPDVDAGEIHTDDEPVQTPVDNLWTNDTPTTAFPASVNPALLTTLNNNLKKEPRPATEAVLAAGQKSSGSALLKKDAAGGAAPSGSPSGLPGSGSALTEKGSLALDDRSLAAIDSVQVAAPHLSVFALRAHLVGALRRPVDFLEVLGWLEHASTAAAARRQRVTIADVIELATSTTLDSQALLGFASQERPGSAGASLVGFADGVGSADG